MLDSCNEEHDHDVFDERYIPERLIDVSSEIPCLKVRENTPLSASSGGLKYAALSYCWGSGTQVKTTADTLQARQAGISETEMPQVLRDAIRVTRALGISFLWMDALCILQDVPSDWEQQCAEMHNIYGSAHVTLCVANSSSSNEAFLQQKVPCLRLPFQSFQAPNKKGSFLVQYNKHMSGAFINPSSDSESGQLLSADVGNSHWTKRGWVFQEKRLSTRKLVFGRCNIYFVCQHIYQARGKCVISGQYEVHIKDVLAQETLQQALDIWNGSILGSYSQYDASSFRRVADVLPALSGLATLFHNRLNDVYYAGHWGRDLYKSLSWTRRGLPSYSMPPAGLMIPSWSRLAKGYTESYVYNHLLWQLDERRPIRSEIRLHKARVSTVGDNPFGVLRECCLWIRGYTLDMSHRELQISFEPQPEVPLTVGASHLVVHGRCFGHLEFDWEDGDDDPGKHPSNEDVKELKLLLLGSFEYEVRTDGEESSEESCSQKHTTDEKTPTVGDGGSGRRQFQVPIMRGYGLIISPTGNDCKFRRVGTVSSARGSHECAPHGDGDLKDLSSLAQMETVQLV